MSDKAMTVDEALNDIDSTARELESEAAALRHHPYAPSGMPGFLASLAKDLDADALTIRQHIATQAAQLARLRSEMERVAQYIDDQRPYTFTPDLAVLKAASDWLRAALRDSEPKE